MSSSRSSRLPAPSDVDPDIVVKYLERLGVTPETTRAIRDEVERKKLEEKKARLLAGGDDGEDGSPGGGEGGDDVRAFARRQGMDAAVRDGDSVMAWGILEGSPEKVEQAYRGLSEFVAASWELYRPELEAVMFPVFVHCYLTLVMFDHGAEARGLMRAWGGEHEERFKDEMTLLKMVTAREHAEASDYCKLVLTHKFRVKICLATSKLLNAFLVNKGLLLVMHILNTRVQFVLEERSPLPFAQVVRCGPDDAFPAALRPRSSDDDKSKEESGAARDTPPSKATKEPAAPATTAGRGGGRGVQEEDLKWAAAPPMEVALMKQTERDVSLPLKPPPQPDPPENWPYLRLALRPLDSAQLKDTLSTPEGGARPFLANPLSPHVVMVTFYNAVDTLCCLKPTRDGMQRNGAAAGGGSGQQQQDSGLADTVRLVGHSQPVYGVSWSPDGRFLLSAGGDGGVRLWDIARGRVGGSAGYVRYDGHCGPVWDVAFGPAGYYFATASDDRTACLWSTDCASPLRIFAGHLKGVLCVTFHPNANYVVTGSMDKTVRVWDVQTGDCVRLLAGHSGSVTCVAVSPSGRLEGSALVSGSKDNTVKIWDVASACKRDGDGRNGVDSSASLAEQMKAAAAAAAAIGDGGRGGGVSAVAGTKRKKGAGGGGGGAPWPSRGDGPSYGPVHSFGTRNTGVFNVLFTKRNLVIASGVCRNKS
ncbi:TFIID and SAGA subunit [Ectocarpus siliculosus]|uniref:TFIID and SAGA subunit n=1 Tax=Ectocarpus siliculosus TaxID=2880 RepID=D7FXT3_ECTSI|nr:TFIID and SAGA subunit [Ectocarpus siliculosus]|eukprot:CBJ32346.1 TFIID and SAGA subunit [Ectocarpus siliculosus]